jgi:hypothetical protein
MKRTMTCQIGIRGFDAQRWHVLASCFGDYTLYQTWNYVQCVTRAEGSDCVPAVVTCGEEPIAAALSRVRRIPGLGTGLAYVNGGPLWWTGNGAVENLPDVLRSLYDAFVEREGLVLRLGIHGPCEVAMQAVAVGMSETGFAPSETDHRPRTVILDLTLSPSELRAGLKKKWRQHLSKVEKMGLPIRAATDVALLDQLIAMYRPMQKEKDFSGSMNLEVLRQTQLDLPEPLKLRVIMAYNADGVPVSGHASSHLGRIGQSILAATTNEGYELQAGYAVWWETILAAKADGMQLYDVGGIDPATNPGGYQFKSGLGGCECQATRAFEAPARGLRHNIVLSTEKLYRWLRNLCRRAGRLT